VGRRARGCPALPCPRLPPLLSRAFPGFGGVRGARLPIGGRTWRTITLRAGAGGANVEHTYPSRAATGERGPLTLRIWAGWYEAARGGYDVGDDFWVYVQIET